VSATRGARTWYALLSSFEQSLFFWRPDVELTAMPVDVLWGPGSWEDLHQASRMHEGTWHAGETVVIDRIFFVRFVGDDVDYPRTATQAQHVSATKGERWVVVKADAPSDFIGIYSVFAATSAACVHASVPSPSSMNDRDEKTP
jgi:hypothetical protein